MIEAGANVDHQDFDGWTPLHAAAHWGQEESCKILSESFCDFDIKDTGSQRAIDVADESLVKLLKELEAKQASVSITISLKWRIRSLTVFHILMGFPQLSFSPALCINIMI